MNFINTIKHYFKNKENINLSITSNDNSFDKLTLESLDFKINQLESLIEGLIDFTELRRYNLTTPEWASNNTISIFILGRMCVITGGIYIGNELATGNHEIPLPISLRPRENQVYDWAPKIVSGATYNVHFEIARNNPSVMNFYNYNTIPASKTIPVTLVFDLDEAPRTEPRTRTIIHL